MKHLRGYFIEILYVIGLVVLYFVVTWLISL